MRTVLPRVQLSFLVLALAGACGDDPAPGGPKHGDLLPDNNGDGQPDGQYVDVNNDGTVDGIDTNFDGKPDYDLNNMPWTGTTGPLADAGNTGNQTLDSGTPTCTPGICTTASGQSGFSTCTQDPSVPCIAVALPEGGFNLGDASFDLPDGALDNLPPCPDGSECSQALASFSSLVPGAPAGASVCGTGGAFPPSCTTNQDCTDMGYTGACFTDPLFGLKFCVQPCGL